MVSAIHSFVELLSELLCLRELLLQGLLHLRDVTVLHVSFPAQRV